MSSEEQIMSKHKCPIIFLKSMEAIVLIILIVDILPFNVSYDISFLFPLLSFLNTSDLKIGEYHSDIPQF